MLTLERPAALAPVQLPPPTPPHTVSPMPPPTPKSAIGGGFAVALMDAIECGLIACDGDGRLLHANRAARREIGPGRALCLVGGRLRCGDALDSVLANAVKDAALRGRRRLFWVGVGDGRQMVVTMPVDAADGSGLPAVLVILGRRNLCSPLGLEMLALRHGLTLAETRVLGGLIETRAARQIAQDHGVRLCTVRTQIQAIREKVGARNIEELLLRVAQVPAITSGLN